VKNDGIGYSQRQPLFPRIYWSIAVSENRIPYENKKISRTSMVYEERGWNDRCAMQARTIGFSLEWRGTRALLDSAAIVCAWKREAYSQWFNRACMCLLDPTGKLLKGSSTMVSGPGIRIVYSSLLVIWLQRGLREPLFATSATPSPFQRFDVAIVGSVLLRLAWDLIKLRDVPLGLAVPVSLTKWRFWWIRFTS